MNPWKLKTINDALKYCQEVVRRYDTDMTPKEKESLASELLGFSCGDYFKVWRKDYPIVDEIQLFAADLNWSNSFDIDEDWEKLRSLIARLEHEVNLHQQH